VRLPPLRRLKVSRITVAGFGGWGKFQVQNPTEIKRKKAARDSSPSPIPLRLRECSRESGRNYRAGRYCSRSAGPCSCCRVGILGLDRRQCARPAEPADPAAAGRTNRSKPTTPAARTAEPEPTAPAVRPCGPTANHPLLRATKSRQARQIFGRWS
jgi:hypothetical protein